MASFNIKAEQILVVGDFAVNYEVDQCNTIPGVWECSVKSLSFTVDTAPARPDVQLALEDAKYDAALVSKVEDAKMIPGAFFWETHDAQPDTTKRHNNNADKATYMTLTAHRLENAGTPVKPAAP